MAMTLLEKILAAHSKHDTVQPGEIVDIEIDARVARDFGGANVVKNLRDFGLAISKIRIKHSLHLTAILQDLTRNML